MTCVHTCTSCWCWQVWASLAGSSRCRDLVALSLLVLEKGERHHPYPLEVEVEQASKQQESFTVQITPGNMTVVVDVYDNNDPNGMPIISEWGYTKEHAVRRTMATVLQGQGFALVGGED